MTIHCEHLDQIRVVRTDERGCLECVELGDQAWQWCFVDQVVVLSVAEASPRTGAR